MLAAPERTAESSLGTLEASATTFSERSASETTADVLPPHIAVVLAQGTIDQIIRPDVTKACMQRLCQAGSKVKMMWLPNIGHARAAQASTIAAVDWITAGFAGDAPANDCFNRAS